MHKIGFTWKTLEREKITVSENSEEELTINIGDYTLKARFLSLIFYLVCTLIITLVFI